VRRSRKAGKPSENEWKWSRKGGKLSGNALKLSEKVGSLSETKVQRRPSINKTAM